MEKHISFTNNGQTHWVVAESHVEQTEPFIKIKFRFQKNQAATDLEFVMADNENGTVRLVTSKGEVLFKGYLYEELLGWCNSMVG